jgi:integrase
MAKRENGAGTEIKWDEAKQLYYQRLGYKEKSGKNKIKAFYGKSKGEIKEKRKEWQKQFDAGIDTELNKMTFANWLEKWLEVYKKNAVAITTFEQNKLTVKNHFTSDEIGATKLKDLTKLNLQDFINRKSEKLAATSMKLLRYVISNSLKFAVENDILLKSPATGLRIPKAKIDKREDIKPFSRNELKDVLKALEGDKLYNIVYVAAFTGMRKGELLGLRWQDVDLVKGVINVRQQAIYNPGTRNIEIGKLKTKNAYRSISIDEKVIAVLKKQKAWNAVKKLELGESYTEQGIVFVDEAGQLLNTVWITKAFYRTIKELGIEYRSFHHLRHTFASIAISKVPNIKAISMTLGHSTITETMDTYGHLLPGDNKTVTGAVAAFLAGL